MKNFFRILFISLCTLLINITYSQARRFKGRLVLLDGNKKSLNNISVTLVNQGPGVTGTDGEFEIAIDNTATSVTLNISDNNLNILYPLNGKISVPKDSDEVVEFIVGDSPQKLLIQALAKKDNELKNNLIQLGVKQEVIQQTLTQFRNEIEVLTSLKLEDFQDQVNLDKKRRDFFPVLTSAINNYINEAKDLKDAFKFSAEHAFDDNAALQVLIDQVKSYNEAFEDINRNHDAYEKMVSDLWQSDAKAIAVTDLFNYALGELHSANIFTLNLKIKDINDYNTGNFKGSKKAFKETITREIEASDLQLERRLDELDKRAQVVITQLAN